MRRRVDESEWGVLNSPLKRLACVAAFAALMGLVAGGVALFSRTASPEPAMPAAQRIVDSGYVGVPREEDMEFLISCGRRGDLTSLAYALYLGAAFEYSTSFKKGEAVHVIQRKPRSGTMQVRRVGETTNYWTLLGATG